MNERNSNFELLRILSILGIICMHILAPVYNSLEGLNLYIGIFINSLFNIGVSCFCLISGYFGIRFNGKKLFLLETLVLSYTIMELILMVIMNSSIGLRTLVFGFLPVSMRRYWFITCYFALCCLAPFLNDLIEKCNKKYCINLLGIMFLIFYLLPTVTVQRDIMLDDGKGLANMIFLYLSGRWIRKYENDIIINKKVLGGVFISTLTIEFILNSAFSYIKGWHGIYAPFARDCSVFILIIAITVFLIFKDLSFKSKVVNFAARGVLAAYIFEGILRDRLSLQNITIVLSEKGYFIVYVIALAFVLFFATTTIEAIRTRMLDRIFSKIYDVLENKLFIIRSKSSKL